MTNKLYEKNLDVQYWSQTSTDKKKNENWGNVITSCGQTMAKEGCVITSIAMIFHSFGDKVDPLILLNALKPTNDDCPFDWAAAQKKYNHKYKGKFSGKFDTYKGKMMDLVMNTGVPLMARVPNHTVVITGFSGTLPVLQNVPDFTKITASMFLVNDPGNAKNKTLQDVINQRGEFEYYNYYEKELK